MIKHIFLSGLMMLVVKAQTAVAPLPQQTATPTTTQYYQSVVRIEVSTQVSDYATPWNAGGFSGGIGTGFLIGPNKFLTNAHVISDAQRILITIYGSPQKYAAKVEFVAHDCDLAILSVEDFTPFEKLPIFFLK